jgi:hypothetical protein
MVSGDLAAPISDLENNGLASGVDYIHLEPPKFAMIGQEG